MAEEGAEAAEQPPQPQPVLADEVCEARAPLITEIYKDVTTAECKYHAKTERTENEELKDIQERLTFGELSFANLFMILNCCRDVGDLYPGGVFIDCGSAVGRQVLSASVLHDFTKCVGIECLEKLDGIGQKVLGAWNEGKENLPEDVPKGEVALVKADFVEEVANHIAEEQAIILAVAPCYEEKLMEDLCVGIAKAPLGSMFVTISKACPDIDLWEPVHIQQMECPWGAATLFIHTKIKMPPEEG